MLVPVDGPRVFESPLDIGVTVYTMFIMWL